MADYQRINSKPSLSNAEIHDTDILLGTHLPDASDNADTKYYLHQLQSMPVAVCSSDASATMKSATISNSGEFTLSSGRLVLVTFTNGNTAGSFTLNINSTGNKSVKYQAGTTLNYQADEGEEYLLCYDGTEWIIVSDITKVDTTATADSTNLITSGAVKAIEDAKQDVLTFDATPTADSSNPVTSTGVKSYVDTAVQAAGLISYKYKVSDAIDTDTSSVINLTIDGAAEADNLAIKITFVGACTGSATPTLSLNGGTAYAIKVPVDGALSDLTSHAVSDVTTWWQAYTTLQLYFDSTNSCWVIDNNPVVLSSSDSTTGYTIKADGSSVYRAYLKTKNQTLTSQTVDAGSEVSWSISPTGITGYTAVGVVGHYTGHTFFIVDVVRLINGVIQMIGRNSASVQLTIAPEVTILYQRI